jgi:hypothetical protein
LLAGDSPEQEKVELELPSTPGAAATTSCFLVVRNIDRCQPRPSPTTGEPSDPLGPLRIGFELAVDDDEPRPFDRVLIRRCMLRTTSAFKKSHWWVGPTVRPPACATRAARPARYSFSLACFVFPPKPTNSNSI